MKLRDRCLFRQFVSHQSERRQRSPREKVRWTGVVYICSMKAVSDRVHYGGILLMDSVEQRHETTPLVCDSRPSSLLKEPRRARIAADGGLAPGRTQLPLLRHRRFVRELAERLSPPRAQSQHRVNARRDRATHLLALSDDLVGEAGFADGAVVVFFCDTFERVKNAILGELLESHTVAIFVRPSARRRARLVATARVRPIAHPDAAVDVVLRHRASSADVLLRS